MRMAAFLRSDSKTYSAAARTSRAILLICGPECPYSCKPPGGFNFGSGPQ